MQADLTSPPPAAPPPAPALAGQALAYLARGNARRQACDFGRALDDFTQALSLDPTLKEARFQRAQTLETRDVAAALAEYDAIIAADAADIEARFRRAALLALTGATVAVLTEFQAIELAAQAAPGGALTRVRVARERARLYESTGYLHAANADYQWLVQNAGAGRAIARTSEDRERMVRNHSRMDWKAGRFDSAAQGFSALLAEARRTRRSTEPLDQVWLYLCKVRIDPARAAAELEHACPQTRNPDALRMSRSGAPPAWEPLGPPCPTAKWPEPLIDMFCGRISPEQFAAMAEPALRISDTWRPPAAGRAAGITEWRVPAQHLWRCEIEFYLGQWHLLAGYVALATGHFSRAWSDRRALTFESAAAACELARMR